VFVTSKLFWPGVANTQAYWFHAKVANKIMCYEYGTRSVSKGQKL